MTDSTVLAQQASAKALSTALSQPETKTTLTKYYMPYNGARFVMPSGKSLVFIGGCLETNIKEEIDEIEKAIASGAAIYKTPMLVVKSDAIPLREVGASSKGARPSGTGMLSSAMIAALAAESSAGKK